MTDSSDDITYYDILGVGTDATEQEIRRAYVALAKELHPDKGGSAQSMRLLNRAYHILRDPERRKQYDASFRHTSHVQPEEQQQPTAEELIMQEQSLVRSVKREAGKAMLIGAALAIVGFVITGISYSAASPGGTYFVTWGIVISGIVAFIRGWYRFLTPYEVLHKVIDTSEYKHRFIFEKRGRKPRAIFIILATCFGIFFLFAYIASLSSSGSNTTLTNSSGSTSAPSSTDTELDTLKSAYNQCVGEYNSDKDSLDSINRQMNSYSSYGNTAAYNALVPRQNQLVQETNDKYNECEAKRLDYNSRL